jgi:hypothetical protein
MLLPTVLGLASRYTRPERVRVTNHWSWLELRVDPFLHCTLEAMALSQGTRFSRDRSLGFSEQSESIFCDLLMIRGGVNRFACEEVVPSFRLVRDACHSYWTGYLAQFSLACDRRIASKEIFPFNQDRNWYTEKVYFHAV